MKIPYYHVDAFTGRAFGGNPAGVCVLEAWLPEGTLRGMAGEHNLSETAFLVRAGEGYEVRWFTPEVEVPLCGHATLAAAHVVFSVLEREWERVVFVSPEAGELPVTRHGNEEGELLELDFPARVPRRLDETDPGTVGMVAEAAGLPPLEVWKAQYLMAVYEEEGLVRDLRPDMERVRGVDDFGLIVTAPGEGCDFVSRFFAPAKGVPEDPVTGSAHCTLAPYWWGKLGKARLHARQVSARGGELFCGYAGGGRVLIAGRAVLYMDGVIHL